MRTLWLTIGDRTTASSRVRAYVIAEELARRGVPSTVVPGGRSPLQRFRQLRAVLHGCDVVVLQKVTPSRLLLAVLKRRADVLVWECDDAVHLGYPGEKQTSITRRNRRIRQVLSIVDVVTTTNPTLARELRPHSGRVLMFPGPAPRRDRRGGDTHPRERTVIWLGSPSTEHNLRLLGNLPDSLGALGWRCVAVGAGEGARVWGWEVVPWSTDAEQEWLGRARVGLMPLEKSPWSDRKAAYKVLEYMSAGVVPVASQSPAAALVFGALQPGVLVPPGESWLNAVTAASDSASQRADHAQLRLKQLSVACFVDCWLELVGSKG